MAKKKSTETLEELIGRTITVRMQIVGVYISIPKEGIVCKDKGGFYLQSGRERIPLDDLNVKK